MSLIRVPGTVIGALLLSCVFVAAETVIQDDAPLQMPPPGAHELRVLTPSVLELTLITTKKSESSSITEWDFAGAEGQARLPGPREFVVLVDGKTNQVKLAGFKRRVLYAPLKQRDLRIGNYLYLELESPIADNQSVEVRNPSQKLWRPDVHFAVKAEPRRWSPVLHVNQAGYLPTQPKKAMVGYFLGNLGELRFENAATGALQFQVIEATSGKQVFQGALLPRPDRGYADYQRVLEADFTAFKTPGEYQLQVAGLGVSFPFFIDDGIAAAFARTYALGLYHQRCGTANELPFTRFIHGPCHVAPAEVPAVTAAAVNEVLEKETADVKKDNPRHTAPAMKNLGASLYPFVNKGKIDVRGGHHDAGDYSKYTINSASFIHLLVFAADNFPGAGDLDNLGLPESGDGKSDLLQEAKWEADFLAKMQDADGGFYFLVYPREREYENDVLPDKGDPQIVYPKTTAVTAAAVAALAQCASSPKFKQQFPDAAALYLDKAKKGWAFLDRAIAKHGKDGAYQRITHYGDDFMHDDELAWAACEMFLATGEDPYRKKLEEWLNPSDPGIQLWSWWRLYASYGNAIRDYAFAVRSGRLKREQVSESFLGDCEKEVELAARDQWQRANQSAYGTSMPDETKKAQTAGWYFSSDAAFDLAVGCQLEYPVMNDLRPKFLDALLGNLNYEAGCNPVNVSYLTGIGWKRQRETVNQYALNDRRVLPPSGIPLGNMQTGFGWLEHYGKELGELSFPPDGDERSPYPFYDRWGDSFNLSQEFVILNQARGLGYLAWLMAQTPLKNQAWKSAPAQITATRAGQKVTAGISAPGLDLSQARIVWEAAGQEPAFGKNFSFTPAKGDSWIEAEALLPDGRRVFGVMNSVPK